MLGWLIFFLVLGSFMAAVIAGELPAPQDPDSAKMPGAWSQPDATDVGPAAPAAFDPGQTDFR